MAIIAVDLGGTKIAGGLFSGEGKLLSEITEPVAGSEGDEILMSITGIIQMLLKEARAEKMKTSAIGVSVPGIYHREKATVWAPNLPGWDQYPLPEKLRIRLGEAIPIAIESDRSCYILGEIWQGNARGSRNAIYMAVGTGIGAGIVINGNVLQGVGYSAGAIGWMALNRPYLAAYQNCGCFEYHASGEGLARVYRAYLGKQPSYRGDLDNISPGKITSKDIFEAYQKKDPIAKQVIGEAVEFWGMSVANLVSIFNPEKIILGGGVFEAAAALFDQVKTEAGKWGQPVAMNQVSIELTALGNRAGLFGAAYLALSSLKKKDAK